MAHERTTLSSLNRGQTVQSSQKDVSLKDIPLLKNFKAGDLLYGLNNYRMVYFNSLKHQLGNQTPIIIDELNNKLLTLICDDNGYNPELEKSYYKTSSMGDLALTDLAKKQMNTSLSYHYFINHLSVLKSVPGHPKISLKNNAFPNNDKKIDVEGRIRRRACKAQLMNMNINIHFLLDGLSMMHIFDRKYSLENSNSNSEYACNYDSYTSTEIRFVFKHYDVIKSHVIFYLNSAQIELVDWVKMQHDNSKQTILDWCKNKSAADKLAKSTLEEFSSIISSSLESKSTKENRCQKLTSQEQAVSEPPVTPVRKGPPPIIKKRKYDFSLSRNNAEGGSEDHSDSDHEKSADTNLDSPPSIRRKFSF